MGLADSIHDLKTLVQSYHPLVVMETVEEARATELLSAVSRETGLPLFEWTVTRGLQRVPTEGETNASWTTEPLQLLTHLEQFQTDALFHLKDFAPHLSTPQTVRLFAEVAVRFSRSRSTMVLTGARCELPESVAHHAVHFHLALPTTSELQPVLRSVLRSLQERTAVRVELSPENTDRLLEALSGLTVNQARQALARVILEDERLDDADVSRLLEHKAQALRREGLLEYLPAQDNAFELGGFARLKAWVERARIGFSGEARAMNLDPPRGILLLGVQGCGKSLAAKCVARTWGLPLLKLEASRLFDKFVGETEKNLQRALRMAESMAPAVLWIDELEKAFSTGGSDADGGVSRRVFGALLIWLQEKRAPVFVVATANDLSLLPPELLRKGRFDEIFFVDLPDEGERREIFRIHLRVRRQEPDSLDLDRLVAASAGMSGAEIEQAVVGALYEALHRGRPLETELVEQEIKATVPLSVSRREDLESLREFAAGRFVPVR